MDGDGRRGTLGLIELPEADVRVVECESMQTSLA
jgi:hypothetical protein